jgi:hypothetical protein
MQDTLWKQIHLGKYVLIALIVDALLLGMFLRWAYVTHHRVDSSVLYGNWRHSTIDGSYIEIWGYAKQCAIIVLAIGAYARQREGFFAAFAALFFMVLLDDALGLHEQAADMTRRHMGMLQPSELPAILAISGIPFVTVLIGLTRLPLHRRRPATALTLAFVVLATFSVGIDAMNDMVLSSRRSGQTLKAFFEDGGELVSLTAILALWPSNSVTG